MITKGDDKKMITIKKAESKTIYSKKLARLNDKGLDTKKYAGKIKISEDALIIQKRLRNEWQ